MKIQAPTQLRRTLWMFAITVLQVLLFVVMTFLVESFFPAKHWGVNEGISYWVLFGSFVIFATANSVLMEQYQHWWISIIISIAFCVIAFIINGGFLSYYPYRFMSFLFTAIVSFIFPYILRFFTLRKKEQTKKVQ